SNPPPRLWPQRPSVRGREPVPRAPRTEVAPGPIWTTSDSASQFKILAPTWGFKRRRRLDSGPNHAGAIAADGPENQKLHSSHMSRRVARVAATFTTARRVGWAAFRDRHWVWRESGDDASGAGRRG